MENKKVSKKREKKGTVVGNKMDKTVKVRVDYVTKHPRYKKVIKKNKIFFAHTEKELNVEDAVTIRECKPYSKNVRWVVVHK